MENERVGAAKRRRERRLRSWAKHERMTVAMALVENLHHSRQKVEGGEHDGPRAQKTARATGARPGVLTDPEPQEGAGMVDYMPASVPRLQGHRLNGDGGEAVDGTSLRYLLKKSLARKKEEEEQEEEEEGGAVSSRRRKKRKKKKKVPKTRRRPLPQLVVCRVGMRIRRQGHGFALALRGSGARCVAVACAGLVLLVTTHLALWFPSGVAQPRMLYLGRYGPEGPLQWHVHGWYFWCNCGDSAIAVLRRSSTIFSCRRESSPWSRLVGRP